MRTITELRQALDAALVGMDGENTPEQAQMLEAALDELERLRQAEVRLARVTTQKDDAYSQRNKLVVLLAHMAVRLGWKAGIGRHEGEPWEADWRTIVFIDLPTGQVSWHFHDSEAPLLEGLPKYEGAWDGHSDDEKWSRCREAGTELAFSKPAPKPEPAPTPAQPRNEGDLVLDMERVCCGTCKPGPEAGDCSCRFPPRTVELLAERDSLRRRVAELEGPSSPGVTPLDMELVQTQLELREARAELERIQDERARAPNGGGGG